MKCGHCGAENAQDSVFCQGCGSNLAEAAVQTEMAPENATVVQPEAAPAENAEVQSEAVAAETVEAQPEVIPETNAESVSAESDAKAKKSVKDYLKKPVVLAVAAVVAVVVVIAVLVSLLSGGKYNLVEKNYVLKDNGDETVVFYGDKMLKDTIEGTVDYNYTSNYDGTVVVALSSENELYYIKGNKVESIATEVESFKLAAEGDYVAYRTSSEDDAELYIAKLGGKATEVADDVTNYTVSPDGSAVVYTVIDGYYTDEEFEYEEDITSEMFLYKSKKSVSVGKDYNVYAVSNGGKYIYAEKEDALYVLTKKGENKEKLSDTVSSAVFNSDNTQILFWDEEDKTYVSTKGKKPVKINNNELYPILPGNIAMSDLSADVESFLNCAYQSSDSIYFVNKKGDSEKIASDVYGVTIDNDGEYVYYINDDLVLCKIKAKASGKEKEIADDAAAYRVTSDGKTVYYKDESGDLYSRKGNSKAKSIAEDVESWILTDDDVLIFMHDEDDSGNCTLSYCANGKKVKKIDDDVYDIGGSAGTYYYAVGDSDEYELYASDNGKKFDKLTDIDNSESESSSDLEDYYDEYSDYMDDASDALDEYSEYFDY